MRVCSKTQKAASTDEEAKAAGAEKSKLRPNGITDVLSTPVMLASCEKSWPFQIKGKDKTVHACVKCRPDAPLPLAIGKHGKRLIWACNANKFKKRALCEKSLSWLDPPNKKANQRISETGSSAKKTCYILGSLTDYNNEAAKVYFKHSQDLKLSTTAELTSVLLYSKSRQNNGLQQFKTFSGDVKYPGSPFGRTIIVVEKTIHVTKNSYKTSTVFTVLSHSVRACGNIPKQPLQCLDTKQSKCIWSKVCSNMTYNRSESHVDKFKSGRSLPGTVCAKMYQDRPCGPDEFLDLSTSRRI